MKTLIYATASTWLVLTLVLVGAQSVRVDDRVVVEYNAFESSIKVSSNVDFAGVRVMFDDLPGGSITVKELRDIIKARVPVKMPTKATP